MDEGLRIKDFGIADGSWSEELGLKLGGRRDLAGEILLAHGVLRSQGLRRGDLELVDLALEGVGGLVVAGGAEGEVAVEEVESVSVPMCHLPTIQVVYPASPRISARVAVSLRRWPV